MRSRFFEEQGRLHGAVRTTWLSCALLVSACTGHIAEPSALSSGARSPDVSEDAGVDDELALDGSPGTEVVDDALSPNDASGDPASSVQDAGPASSADAAAPVGVASSGCGKAPPFTGWKAQSITVDGQQRTYDMGVPSAYNNQTRYALVFAYHGLGQEGLFFRNLLDMERVTGNQAIFVYPDGTAVPEGSSGWHLTADSKDIKMFDALVSNLSARFCIDQSAIFGLGFSYGGWMANALGCHRGDKVRGIASIAGGGPSGTCKGAVPAMIIHGETDQAENISAGRRSRDFWRPLNGCTTSTSATSPSPCVSYGGCTEPLLWCQHPGTHLIPDFAQQGMWSFFSGLRQ